MVSVNSAKSSIGSSFVANAKLFIDAIKPMATITLMAMPGNAEVAICKKPTRRKFLSFIFKDFYGDEY